MQGEYFLNLEIIVLIYLNDNFLVFSIAFRNPKPTGTASQKLCDKYICILYIKLHVGPSETNASAKRP